MKKYLTEDDLKRYLEEDVGAEVILVPGFKYLAATAVIRFSNMPEFGFFIELRENGTTRWLISTSLKRRCCVPYGIPLVCGCCINPDPIQIKNLRIICRLNEIDYLFIRKASHFPRSKTIKIFEADRAQDLMEVKYSIKTLRKSIGVHTTFMRL